MLDVSERPPKTGKRARKEGAKKPNRTGRALSCWISDQHAAVLDVYLRSRRPAPSITSLIEVALEDFFRREGIWPEPS